MENTNKADLVMAADGREELRRLASTATPGEWDWWTSNSYMRLTATGGADGGVMHAETLKDGCATIVVSYIDAQFIAAANPQAILALLDEVASLRAALAQAAPASPAGSISDTKLYRTGYGDGVRRAADLCNAKYQARAESGHPREASAARALAEEIRNLQSSGPVNAPASPASAPEASKPTQSVLDFLHHCAGAAGHDVDGTRLAQMARSALKSVAAPLPPVVARKVLTDDEILTLCAPYLSDGQGFVRKPELFEIVACARAIERHLMGGE